MIFLLCKSLEWCYVICERVCQLCSTKFFINFGITVFKIILTLCFVPHRKWDKPVIFLWNDLFVLFFFFSCCFYTFCQLSLNYYNNASPSRILSANNHPTPPSTRGDIIIPVSLLLFMCLLYFLTALPKSITRLFQNEDWQQVAIPAPFCACQCNDSCYALFSYVTSMPPTSSPWITNTASPSRRLTASSHPTPSLPPLPRVATITSRAHPNMSASVTHYCMVHMTSSRHLRFNFRCSFHYLMSKWLPAGNYESSADFVYLMELDSQTSRLDS